MPTPNSDTPAQGPRLEDAARAFEGLLDREDGTSAPEEEAAPEVPADTSESVAAEAAPEETTADEADAGTDEAAEAEGAQDADQKRPQTIPVTIDGKVEEVTLEEAAKGYQRQSDYSRKTADLANQRRALEEQAQAVREERQTYATMLAALREQISTGGETEPNWEEIWKADPIGYARKRDEWRDKQDKVAAANFELQRLQSLKQQEQTEILKKTVEVGRQKMMDLNPAWKDPKTWDSDRQRIVEYALRPEVGYSAEEIGQAYDPRAIVLLHKARLYDELMAKKPQPVAARGPRVASAGPAPPQGTSARLNAAQQRLAKSGRIADAAKVFEQLI
jgi:hypothetical protein